MGKLVDVEKTESIVEYRASGTVFIGHREWVQVTHGERFTAEQVAEAKVIAKFEIDHSADPDVYGAIREWAAEAGLNEYKAGILAGHLWRDPVLVERG